MTTPIKIGCHCGFVAESPEEMADHILLTKHIDMPDDMDGPGLAEFIAMLGVAQRFSSALEAGETLELPEGVEINELSEADILADDDLCDEEKHEILARLAEVRTLKDKP